MSIEKRICEAFCAEVRVNPFKGGFGVSTPFANGTGDLLGYYILGPSERGTYRIVDNALTVAGFESEGATLDADSRLSAFNEIISTYGAYYDEGTGELSIEDISQSEIEHKSLDFMVMLLRLQDMYFLTQERTRSTFLEDVSNKLESLRVPGLSIKANEPVSDDLNDVIPDFVLSKSDKPKPVALFLVNNNEKLWQAMHLKLVAEHEAHKPLSVVAMLESDNTGSAKIRAKAANRLNALTNWRGDEAAALTRLLSELDISSPSVH